MSTPETNYRTTITSSSREFTAREKLRMMDTTGAQKLNEIIESNNHIDITVSAWAVLHIENNMSEDKEYDTYVILDTEGNIYSTGSSSFATAFANIALVMEAEQDDEYTIRVFSRPSKKFKGKSYITCSLL